MKFRIPFDRVNWVTSSFLIGTLFLALTATPAYIWHFGLNWFQIALFCVMFAFTGFSITLGYHRLFSHLSFKAHWSIRLFTLIFGAGRLRELRAHVVFRASPPSQVRRSGG